MVTLAGLQTWVGVLRRTRWSVWEVTWNRSIGGILNGSGDGTFTKDRVLNDSGIGEVGLSLWDQRWAQFVARHRDIIEQVLANMLENGQYQKYRADGLSDEEIWERLIQAAVESGIYPVWADPHRAPGEPGVYALFDLASFTELMMRGVKAGVSRIENIGRHRYLPAKALFPSVQQRARVALDGVESRPVLTDGARDLIRIECEKCGNVYATQAGFVRHYTICPGTRSA